MPHPQEFKLAITQSQSRPFSGGGGEGRWGERLGFYHLHILASFTQGAFVLFPMKSGSSFWLNNRRTVTSSVCRDQGLFSLLWVRWKPTVPSLSKYLTPAQNHTSGRVRVRRRADTLIRRYLPRVRRVLSRHPWPIASSLTLAHLINRVLP